MDKVIDQLGLVLENQFLTVFIPITKRALVFRILSRINKGYEQLCYGSLPLKKDESLPTYDKLTSVVPENGILPARAYTIEGRTFPAIIPDVYDQTDMWFTPEIDRQYLFHVIHKYTPEWLRVDVQIPKGLVQGRFQGGRVVTGIDKDFGFARGTFEIVHFPEIYYGYRWGNDTNLDVHTFVEFVFGEYQVEIPKDPELIFNILTRKMNSHWVTLPLNVYDKSVEMALIRVYGFEGFLLYRVDQKEIALEDYKRIIPRVLV